MVTTSRPGSALGAMCEGTWSDDGDWRSKEGERGGRKQGRKSRGNAFAATIAALERNEREREGGVRQSLEKNGPTGAQHHKAQSLRPTSQSLR